MPTLPSLLASGGPLLVLDAASSVIQVGVLRPDGASCWQRPAGDAGGALFAGTEAALAAAGIPLADVGAFLFCEGPGSMLGIRTAAMALRTWQILQPRPAYAYQSLAVAGHHAWSTGGRRAFTVIADARRDRWHAQSVAADGRLSPLRQVPTAALPAGELLQPEHFRTWSPLPGPVASCSYDLAALFGSLGSAGLFRPVDAPDACQPEAPDYRKWSAQAHSAATAPPRRTP